MTAKPLSRHTKLATAVPVALVSGLWTAQLVLSGGAAVGANDKARTPLPDGTQVPAVAITEPASIPVAGTLGNAVPVAKADQVIAEATTSGIPAPALAAYQRAAQTVSQADKRCNLPWALLAAIGRAESDHGQYDQNVLNDHGESRPGVFGPTLNGTDGTPLVEDSDSGKIDQDGVYDRGVGAMQIVPTTWRIIKVDGDGDGKSDPQNVNDAALGAAVYLCSGEANLGTRADKEAALFRYHPERNYVNLVLRVMEAYQTGDFTAMPSSNWGGKTYTPDRDRKQAEPEFNDNPGARPRIDKQQRNSPIPSAQPTPNPPSPEPSPQDPLPNNPQPSNPNPQPQENLNPPSNPEPSTPPAAPEQSNPEPNEPAPTPPSPSPSPEPPAPSPSPEPPAPQQPETGPADGPGDSPSNDPGQGPADPEPSAAPSDPPTDSPGDTPSDAPGGDNGDPGDTGSGDTGAGPGDNTGPGDGDGPGDSEGPGDNNGPGDGGDNGPGTDPGPSLPTDPPSPTPTDEPTLEPTPEPSYEPTPEPSYEPTPEPSYEPTPEPTIEPSPTGPSVPHPTFDPWADWWRFLADTQDCWTQVPSGPADDNWWICMGEKGWK